MGRDLSCEEFLKLAKPEADCALRGAELQKLFWKVRGIEKEVERQRAFWASTNQTLEGVYRQLEASTAQLWEKNKKVQSILEHIDQGICTIDESLVVQAEHSSHLVKLLSVPAPAGRSIVELLIEPSSLNAEKRAQLLSAIQNILGYDKLAYDLNAEWLPNEMTLRLSAHEGATPRERNWETDWIPIENQAGVVEKMMICIRDVTELRQARSEAESQRIELEKTGQLLKVPSHTWERFSANAQRQLDRVRELMGDASRPGLQEAAANFIFMELHTLKGNARAYDLTHLSQCAHMAEQRYADFRNTPVSAPWTPAELQADLSQVQDCLDSYRHIVKERLLNYASIQNETRLAFGDVLKPLWLSVPSLARQLGKANPRLVVQGAEKGVNVACAARLEGLLNHVLRNSMDHGLEAGSIGELRFELSETTNGWTLRCRDSGRGLDLAGLRQRHANPQCSDEEAAEMIFAPGVSTARQVSDISGRGVGMGAVRQLLAELGGSLCLELDPPAEPHPGFRRFALRMDFPREVFF